MLMRMKKRHALQEGYGFGHKVIQRAEFYNGEE